MTQPQRRLIERITQGDYLEGLSEISMEQLRTMKEECRQGEAEISFERRLAQARIDILEAELDRRAGTGGNDLVARLPEILAAEQGPSGQPLPTRAPDFSIPRNVDMPRRRVEEIIGENTLARLSQIEADEARSILASLATFEQSLSSRRKAIHEVMDQIQAEIVRRYLAGEEDPNSALDRLQG
jgi:hypothetical protein